MLIHGNYDDEGTLEEEEMLEDVEEVGSSGELTDLQKVKTLAGWVLWVVNGNFYQEFIIKYYELLLLHVFDSNYLILLTTAYHACEECTCSP